MLSHYRKVADYLLIDGASVTQIDTAMERFGFAMGPFAVADLAGLEIGWATRKRRARTRPRRMDADATALAIRRHIENGRTRFLANLSKQSARGNRAPGAGKAPHGAVSHVAQIG